MVNVLFLGPGYPGEMPLFTRGLAEVGATVIGVGDQPPDALPELSRRALADYIQIGSWGDEDGIMRTVLDRLRGRNVDLVETLWEPTVVVAARLREAIGTPGMSVDQAWAFRDKGRMKEIVEKAGIRTPRAERSTTVAGCRDAAGRDRLPADHQADLRSRLARHLSHRERRRARSRTAASRPHRRGQRRGVHRRRGVHVRHGLRRRRDRLLQHRRVPATAARRQAGGVDQPAGHRPSPTRPSVPGRRQDDGRGGADGDGVHERLHPHGVVPHRRRERSSSARSEHVRQAPG